MPSEGSWFGMKTILKAWRGVGEGLTYACFSFPAGLHVTPGMSTQLSMVFQAPCYSSSWTWRLFGKFTVRRGQVTVPRHLVRMAASCHCGSFFFFFTEFTSKSADSGVRQIILHNMEALGSTAEGLGAEIRSSEEEDPTFRGEPQGQLCPRPPSADLLLNSPVVFLKQISPRTHILWFCACGEL